MGRLDGDSPLEAGKVANGSDHDPLKASNRGSDAPVSRRESKTPERPFPPDARKSPMIRLGGGRLATLKPGTSIRLDLSQVDVCFVFDTTGSMSDKIDGLVACMTDFVDAFSKLSLDWRSTCVPFGDLTVAGDRVESQLPFVVSAEDAKAQLRAMPRFSGGGNTGESSIEAMLAGIGKPWRQNAVRVLVLLTDEPALESHRAALIHEKIVANEIICFVASVPEPYYREWAEKNGGQWVPIGPTMDTSALLDVLRNLVRDVAKVARDVHALAEGSVRKYLELSRGTDS